jgi:hypothetical protein
VHADDWVGLLLHVVVAVVAGLNAEVTKPDLEDLGSRS